MIWDRQRYELERPFCDSDGPIAMARERYDPFLSLEAFARGKTRKRTFQRKPKT